jgi:hypothetical protein
VEPEQGEEVKLQAVVLAAVALASGCATDTSRYAWGPYEEHVWRMCEDRDAVEIGQEIREISAAIEKADAESRPVAPGIHAELGYLYAISGNPDSAVQQFEIEKSLYPESTVFLDGCIARMKR